MQHSTSFQIACYPTRKICYHPDFANEKEIDYKQWHDLHQAFLFEFPTLYWDVMYWTASL